MLKNTCPTVKHGGGNVMFSGASLPSELVNFTKLSVNIEAVSQNISLEIKALINGSFKGTMTSSIFPKLWKNAPKTLTSTLETICLAEQCQEDAYKTLFDTSCEKLNKSEVMLSCKCNERRWTLK